jgi:Ca2+-binding RTX toxin-like protein
VPFDNDQVRSNVENITGTAGNDRILSEGANSTIDGGAGNDYIDGSTGNDVLIGGQGRDTLLGGPGVDNLVATDREPDTLDCGTESDIVNRDSFETKVMRCESDFVGVLRLDRRAIRATADEPTEIGLGWRHPLRWKLLRSVTIHVADGPARVGSIEIDLHSGRATASGAVRLARPKIELETEGRDVRAVLPVRFDATLQERKLTLAVEARERSGRRQVVERAATVRVR